MKKKIIISLVFFINISYICFSQGPQGKFNKAEAVQKAYLTKELELTSEETERFWPVFKSYKQEIRKARQENRDDELKFEERILAIKKKFQPEFKKILSSDQKVNKIYTADKNFREMLRRELEERKKNSKT